MKIRSDMATQMFGKKCNSSTIVRVGNSCSCIDIWGIVGQEVSIKLRISVGDFYWSEVQGTEKVGVEKKMVHSKLSALETVG